MKTFFITGTDTDVGKTVVSCALLAQFRQQGWLCAGYKPISAGCQFTAQGLVNEDAHQLKMRSDFPLCYQQVNPFAFEPAIAPHIAAKADQQRIDFTTLSEGLAQLEAAGAQLCLVEGAGGWHLPVDDERLLSDWVSLENIPVILVVGAKLGCLNHAILTYNAIRANHLPIAGWVFNTLPAPMSHHQENLETLRKRIAAPFLGVLPYIENPMVQDLSGYLDISPLC